MYILGQKANPMKSLTDLSQELSISKRTLQRRLAEFEKEEISLSPGVRFLVCFCDLSVIACEQLSELKNAERKIKIVENDRYSLEAEFICEEDICEKQFINIFEPN